MHLILIYIFINISNIALLENTFWGTSKAREERKKKVGREGGSKEERERNWKEEAYFD